MPFNTFANRADPDQAALKIAFSVGLGRIMIRYDPTLVDLTSIFSMYEYECLFIQLFIVGGA